MKGQKKTPKLPGFIRVIVADNVQRRMDHAFAQSSDRPRALARATGRPGAGGLSKSTIQRILAGESGSSIDKLEVVAEALGLAIYQLFIPMLDVTRPPEIPGAEMNEMRMFKEWKRASQDTREKKRRDSDDVRRAQGGE